MLSTMNKTAFLFSFKKNVDLSFGHNNIITNAHILLLHHMYSSALHKFLDFD